MERREIFRTFSLLVEIEGYFTHEFVSYVYEALKMLKTEKKFGSRNSAKRS
jgi:hypothetical protein